MSSVAEQAFVYFARKLTPATYKQALKIKKELQGVADFYILSYRQDIKLNSFEKEFEKNIIIVDRDTLATNCHKFYNKYNNKSDWMIMPGNLDLAQLTMINKIKKYDFYWFCEDDVRFGGNMSTVLEMYNNAQADLLCTNLRPIPKRWFFTNTYKNSNERTPQLLSFLPFFRVSRSAINQILLAYEKGVGGHHEITWPNILISKGLVVKDFHSDDSTLYTSDLTRLSMGWGSFCYFPPKLIINKNSGLLYHPVKSFKDYIRMYKKYIMLRLRKLRK